MYGLADVVADLLPLAASYLALRLGWSALRPLADLAATVVILLCGADLIGLA